MTVALEEPADTAGDERQDVLDPPAGWWVRATAFAIDVLCPLAAAVTLLLVGWSAPRGGWLWWICLVLAAVVLLAIAANRMLLPAATGWSVGRSVVGIAVKDRDGDEPPSAGRLLLRDAAHLLDTVPMALGWLWPLLDARGRTFADLLTRTEARNAEGGLPDRQRIAAAVIGAATALAVLAAALGYGVVYRQQQAVAKARAQIAADGPKLVSDMLSYTVKSAPDDFARAQTLVTDSYRPELIKQQETVQKTGLVDNDYWVSNSSVLSASADRATMLLLLQGQRGIAPNQRFVTASLRADYARSGADWKVSNLTVLAAPKPPPAAAAPAKPEPGKPEPAKPKPAPAEQPKPAPAKPEQPKPAAPKPGGGGR